MNPPALSRVTGHATADASDASDVCATACAPTYRVIAARPNARIAPPRSINSARSHATTSCSPRGSGQARRGFRSGDVSREDGRRVVSDDVVSARSISPWSRAVDEGGSPSASRPARRRASASTSASRDGLRRRRSSTRVAAAALGASPSPSGKRSARANSAATARAPSASGGVSSPTKKSRPSPSRATMTAETMTEPSATPAA